VWPVTEDPAPTLRDHAREAVRAEVQRQAWRLFADHGYEATTVDRIAAASGMSRRTFFRYFASKDDLVLARMVESGGQIAAALEARPAAEPAWVALRSAFQVIVDKQLAQPQRSRPLQLMLRDEPAVRASVEEWRRRWTTLLAPAVAARMSVRDGYEQLRAEALVRSALECLESAQEAWAERSDADLSLLVDVAMGAVAPL
jgi:AcrR family transcriptional regulator